jgi:hypothetical protein
MVARISSNPPTAFVELVEITTRIREAPKSRKDSGTSEIHMQQPIHGADTQQTTLGGD